MTDSDIYERAGVDRMSALPRDGRGESVIPTALLKGTEPLI